MSDEANPDATAAGRRIAILAGRRVSEQMRVRLAKAERLRAAGIEPYPVGYPRTHTIAEVRKSHADLPPDTATGERVGVAGRVMLYRTGGKLCFATIRDATGESR